MSETPEQTARVLYRQARQRIIGYFGAESRPMRQFELEWERAANWRVRASICVGWLTYLTGVEDAEREGWGGL